MTSSWSPPTPDAAGSFLARLKAGTNAVRILDWPGRDGVQVGARPLSARLIGEAELAASMVLGRFPETTHARPHALAAFDRRLTYELLFRVLVVPGGLQPIATSADELLELLDLDEAEALSALALDELEDVSPPLGEMGAAGLEEAADALGKAGAPGSGSSGSAPSAGAPSSDSRPSTSPTGSSSTSSPASASSGAPAAGAPLRTPGRSPGLSISGPASTRTG